MRPDRAWDPPSVSLQLPMDTLRTSAQPVSGQPGSEQVDPQAEPSQPHSCQLDHHLHLLKSHISPRERREHDPTSQSNYLVGLCSAHAIFPARLCHMYCCSHSSGRGGQREAPRPHIPPQAQGLTFPLHCKKQQGLCLSRGLLVSTHHPIPDFGTPRPP